MKLLLFAASFCVIAATITTAQESSPTQAKAETIALAMQDLLGYTEKEALAVVAAGEQTVDKFSNLSQESKLRYQQAYARGNQLLGAGNHTAAYSEYLTAETIFAGDYELEAKLGSVHVQMRLFDKAEQYLRSALSKSPLTIPLRYDLGEVLFVSKQFEGAIEQFKLARKILSVRAPNDTRFVNLVDFKLQLCYLGMRDSKPEGSEEYKTFNQLFKELNTKCSVRTFSHLYYYSNALSALERGDKLDGKKWQNQATQVFPKKVMHNYYVDALIEAGYMRSFYGGKRE